MTGPACDGCGEPEAAPRCYDCRRADFLMDAPIVEPDLAPEIRRLRVMLRRSRAELADAGRTIHAFAVQAERAERP